MQQLSTDFGDPIAQQIRAAHREIAERWLHRLEAILSVETSEIFPSAEILDHIPALIHEIADHVGVASSEGLVANTTAFAKARELGELRFAQKASVHQLLREYRILGAVLGAFVQERFAQLAPSPPPAEAITVMNRLSEAVFILLQTTVDTFVGRYTERIEEQTERLEGFNRMVSHELRQPLSSVLYAVELLRGPAIADAEKRSHVMDIADRNARRLAQLLGMLGALARPETDNPQLQSIDVSKLVHEVLRQLRDLAQSRSVALRAVVGARALTVDVSRLELVLINLVSNAIKYSDSSKPEPFVEVALLDDTDECVLRVSDNGLGIAEADQPGIFRKFFRAHAAQDGALGTDGLGLGLAIVAECVKAMGGTIAFTSREGVGSTFVVTLPVQAESPRGSTST
ncbi:MAG: sensor histidine kinase [Vicinamibacterales bacterium]